MLIKMPKKKKTFIARKVKTFPWFKVSKDILILLLGENAAGDFEPFSFIVQRKVDQTKNKIKLNKSSEKNKWFHTSGKKKEMNFKAYEF